MGFKNLDFKDEKRTQNKVMIQNYSIIATLIFITFVMGFIRNERSIAYIAAFTVLALAPQLAATFMYKKVNPRSDKIKHIIAIGCIFVYPFIVFTTYNDLTFMCGIPVLMISQVYQDKKYTLRIGIGITLTIIARIIYCSMAHIPTDSTTLSLQIATAIMVTAFSYSTTNVIEGFNKTKTNEIIEKNESETNLLNSIKNSTKVLCDDIEYIANETSSIAAQGQDTFVVAENMISGILEINKTVQGQVARTEKIATLTEETNAVAKEVQSKFEHTKETAKNGNHSMNKLDKATNLNKEAGNNVNITMEKLVEKTNEAKTILETIQSITKQINILTLNASIEAERAGEFGKGFAVVADEITKLSKNTNNATKEIAEIFEELEAQSNSATESVNVLLDSTEKQSDVVLEVKDAFKQIRNSIEDMSNSMEKQFGCINNINEVNTDIRKIIIEVGEFADEAVEISKGVRTVTTQTIEGTQNISSLTNKLMEETENLKELFNE